MPTNSALRTPKSRCPDRLSQPKVAHQVETNVVTRAERTPVTLRGVDCGAPPPPAQKKKKTRPQGGDQVRNTGKAIAEELERIAPGVASWDAQVNRAQS